MTLFSRFFRKAAPPSPPTLEDRIATLNAGSAELILDTALGNDEKGLRLAAIQQLPDGEALRRLARLSSVAEGAPWAAVPALERAAQARVAQLIDAGSIDFVGLCGGAGSGPAMLNVAALCKEPGRLRQVLASINDPLQVAQLVADSPSSRVRQFAAELLEDPVQLRQLLRQARTKDKSVYKILKQKCDALNAEDRKTAEIANEIGAVCAALERHSHRTYDALYPSSFDQLLSRWRSLNAAPAADMEQRAEGAMDRCREVIAEHLRQVAQQAAADAEQQADHDARERALQADREIAVAQADAAAELRKEASAARDAEERARAEKLAVDEQIFRQIGGLIRKANGALNDGNTQRAAGLRRAIEERLPSAPTLPTHIVRQLQQLDGKLNELKQWKDYAVAPKRISLIEEMEMLIGSTEEPKVLADRIKSLQEEWRTISKGIVSETPEDWERFHRASQAAYQPCHDYFQAQAQLRQANLENRKAVLGRLAAFETTQSAENPDGRLLARVLREAGQEWRRHFPVDREPGRAIQGDFDALIARLQARLDAWYARNVADKEALIGRARHLLAQADSREAIEAMKPLQILWKESGLAPRDQDQSLWSEFREACDAVYQKRQQAYAEYTAALEANKLKAVALCEEAERIGALSGTALLEGAVRIPEWRSAFDALDEMPRSDARELHDRFERALDVCKARVAQQHARDAERSVTNLFEAARYVRAYEWAIAANAEASERQTLKQAAEAFIAGVQRWPKGGLQAVTEALAKAGAAAAADFEAREKALRTLCIRCEIRSDTPTPPEDEASRREYQVQRLMRGMGQGSRADDGDWDAMVLDWIRIGAVSPAVYDRLQGRFMRCRALPRSSRA
jgi:hypothetical protein